MDPESRSRLLKEVQRLPEAVLAHIEQVRLKSVELASRFSLDVAQAELAAQAHDVCRTTSGKELLSMARSFGIPVTAIEEAVPVFLHGPVGAEVLRRDYALDDEAVLSPIRCHTMGREYMTPLDKVLFLADKLEPSKVGRYPFIAEVDRLAGQDLDEALLYFFDHQMKAFIDHGDLVHPGMLAARNQVVLALKGKS